MSERTCDACADGRQLPFEIIMAFQPIVDITTQQVWGYEALVRGINGEGAGSILSKLNAENLYRFDQSAA